MAELLSLSFLALAFVLALVSWLMHRRLGGQLPPGPMGLPFLGYHPFLSDKPYKDFQCLSAKFGDVFSYRSLGGRLVVVLNGARTVREVLVNRADEFIGRPLVPNLIAWVSEGNGMTPEEGDKWREQRRFFLSTAKNYGFGKLELESRIHDEYRQMLSDLRDTGGRDTDMHRHIAYANNCIISHLLFSKKFTKERFERELVAGFTDINNLFIGKRHLLAGFMLYVVLQFSSQLKAAKKSKQMFMRLIADIVADHKKSLDPSNPRDYVDEYILRRQKRIVDTGSEGHFTIERLQASSLNLFLDGTESVSYTVAKFLEELSCHPEAQIGVQVELDSVVGKERLVSWADRPGLPRLEATVQELYRVRAPFNTSTLYSNFEETVIGGYRIPARSVLVYNIGGFHFDPETYPDPEKFNPGRFLDADGKIFKREKDPAPVKPWLKWKSSS